MKTLNFIKILVLTSSLMAVAGCSTNNQPYDGSDYAGRSASEIQINELATKVGDRVFFEFDSSALTVEAQDTLRKQAAFMQQNPQLMFIIEGHADERGTREYNIALGARRGNSIKEFLMSLGVDARRLKIVSYGKERPAVKRKEGATFESDEWIWSQNRRGVTVAE